MKNSIRIKLFLGITLFTLFISSLLGFFLYKISIEVYSDTIHSTQINKNEISEKDLSNAKDKFINYALKAFLISFISTILITFYFGNHLINFIDSILDLNEELEESNKKASKHIQDLGFEIEEKSKEYLQVKAEQASNLGILKFSTGNLLAIINDFLDCTKTETNTIQFTKKVFVPSQLFNSICDSFKLILKDRNLEFTLEIDERLPKRIIGDPNRLYHIMNNLILIAIQFTPKGGIHLFLKLNSSTKSAVKIDFSVVDTGIGMPSQELKSVFDDFAPRSPSSSPVEGDLGLRLSITKKLLELQGSKIFIESQPNIGTNFYFSLTFDLPVEEFSSNKKEIQKPEPSLSHVKLLLVEDYKLNQMVVEEFLNIWKISVDIADNGMIAVEMADKNEYTIILMDLQMPVLDGYEATRLIRSLPNNKYKTVPIIALTASAIQETIARVKNSGMNDYITKPFKPDVLYKKIVQYISNLS